MQCHKEQIRSQFSKYHFQNESALAHKLREAADSFWNQYFENCGRIWSLWHLIILLADRILSPFTRLRATKTGSKLPHNFWTQGICSPMYTGLFTYYGPSQYLFSFTSNRQKSKQIIFSLISVSACKKIWRPAAASISMPPTFPIASLNRYTLKFSGVA